MTNIDKLILAVDPETRLERIFVFCGQYPSILGWPVVDMYTQLGEPTKSYTLPNLQNASFNDNKPVRIYELKETYKPEDSRQRELFSW